MLELHISPTQGQQRSVGTNIKTGAQAFGQITSGTLCLDTASGRSTTKTEGIYLGGTGKFTGVTGTFTGQGSGSYLMFGFKNGVFGQFTATAEATINLQNGKKD